MTDLFFGLKQNSLTLQTLQDGVLIEKEKARQNGAAPDVGRFQIFAVDSADTGRKANFVDRTWVDQGEGIGIRDGNDWSIGDKKRIDGDETLGIKVGGFQSKKADIKLERLISTDGAQIRVKAFKEGVEVDSQIIEVSGNGRQTLNFSSLFSFDEIQISAADSDTKFAFRSINLIDAEPEVLRFRQKPNNLDFQVLQGDTLVAQEASSQNGTVPNVDPFVIDAVDSPDFGKNADFVDRTFVDQGEGVGIKDGNDNITTQKRIDGDEILGVNFADNLTTDALVKVARVASTDGAEIKVEAFRSGTSVASEIFTLGSGQLPGTNTLTFGSTSFFDSLQISAADTDTQFTFRGVDLPGAFTA